MDSVKDYKSDLHSVLSLVEECSIELDALEHDMGDCDDSNTELTIELTSASSYCYETLDCLNKVIRLVNKCEQ